MNSMDISLFAKKILMTSLKKVKRKFLKKLMQSLSKGKTLCLLIFRATLLAKRKPINTKRQGTETPNNLSLSLISIDAVWQINPMRLANNAKRATTSSNRSSNQKPVFSTRWWCIECRIVGNAGILVSRSTPSASVLHR